MLKVFCWKIEWGYHSEARNWEKNEKNRKGFNTKPSSEIHTHFGSIVDVFRPSISQNFFKDTWHSSRRDSASITNLKWNATNGLVIDPGQSCSFNRVTAHFHSRRKVLPCYVGVLYVESECHEYYCYKWQNNELQHSSRCEWNPEHISIYRIFCHHCRL